MWMTPWPNMRDTNPQNTEINEAIMIFYLFAFVVQFFFYSFLFLTMHCPSLHTNFGGKTRRDWMQLRLVFLQSCENFSITSIQSASEPALCSWSVRLCSIRTPQEWSQQWWWIKKSRIRHTKCVISSKEIDRQMWQREIHNQKRMESKLKFGIMNSEKWRWFNSPLQVFVSTGIKRMWAYF